MSKHVRLFFDRKKKATKDVAGAVEIVICLQRERTYIYSGIRVFKDQWKDGAIVKHPRAVPLNEDLQSQIEKYEKILIAMEVNGDEMRIRNFKSYLTYDGGIRRNFMPWMRERIENRILREGTRRGHMTTYNALMRFGRFKTFDDLTTENIYAFDIFIREEKTFTKKGKPIIRNQAAIHNYHKRFKSYVNEAFRLGFIRDNPYNRFIDKRGEGSQRPHLSKLQVQKLIQMRDATTETQTIKYLDFFLFQLFTGMAYSDARLFDC